MSDEHHISELETTKLLLEIIINRFEKKVFGR